MDTNLKKSKKIKAFLYRMITVAACFTMLMTALLGREAFVNLNKEGWYTMTGNIYYLTEFREYISSLYTTGMLGYAGLGDDKGYPITGDGSSNLEKVYKKEFITLIGNAEVDLICYLDYGSASRKQINVKTPLFSQHDNRLLLPENVTLCCYWNGSTGKLEFFPTADGTSPKAPEDYYSQQYKPNKENISSVTMVIGFLDDGSLESPYMAQLDQLAKNHQRILLTFFGSLILAIIFGLLSLFTGKAGKQAQVDYAQYSVKIWTEVKILVLIVLWFVHYHLHLWHFNGALHYRIYASNYLWLYYIMGILLYLLYTDLRLNQVALWRQSLTCSLVQYAKDYLKSLPWYRKLSNTYICVRLSGLLLLLAAVFVYGLNAGTNPDLFSVVLLVAGIILLLYSIRLKHFIKDTRAMTEKLSQLRQGNTETVLTVNKNSLLHQAAEDLNAVENGIETAIEQSNRSNKMRVELITNVSHDLKTPLTSIINYADLLCEENLPAPAAEYASALRTKANRLKGMVQDVFELSKATSGNLPVETVRLDLAKLVRQTLADMDERIQESNLTFKLHIISEPLMIEADGEKLYRVFQNLIINALQYSLDYSRVFLQLDQKDGYAYAKIKNTSREELDFDPGEIIERFVRQDSSRTTEGSGLGLSIVQSFTEACGGTFSLELDADLFTACLRFPLAAMDSQGETEHETT